MYCTDKMVMEISVKEENKVEYIKSIDKIILKANFTAALYENNEMP